MRITSVLTVFADGSKLPPLLIFKGQPTPKGKSPAANSIEREFKNYKDRKAYAYPRGMAYAVDPKGWHSQRVFDDVWVPQVWNRRPGRLGRLGGYRQPDTLLAWDDYTVHKTDASVKKMTESNTTLFNIPGGLTPKLQPCDGLVNKIFKANMSRLYDDHMASNNVTRNDRGYPEPPSRGLVAQWVKKAWDALTPDEIRSSWRKAGLLLPFGGSEDEAWANKELGSNTQGEPIGGPLAAADKADSPSEAENLLEAFDIEDDDDTGVVVVEIHQAFSSRRQCIPSRGTPPFPSQLECPPASHLRHLFGVVAGAASDIVDSSGRGKPSSEMLLEGDRRRAAHQGIQATQSRDRRIDAFIVALGRACLGKPWYTSTKELQLASLQFCLACRSAPTLRVIVNDDVPIRLLIDSVTLKRYWHSKEPNRSRVPSVQYHALNTMTWMMSPEFLKTGGEVLEHVRSLTIDDEQNRAVIGAVYPPNLKVLNFGHSFNRSMKNSSLPTSLQELTFGRKFNQRIDTFSWPQSLQRVTFGTSFNKPIGRVPFPTSLQHITFKGYFNQEIEQVSWPRDLQELDLGVKFNMCIDKVKWPPSLQKIIFGFRFNQRIDRTAWPLRLHELVLDCKFDQEIILPPSLKHLTLHLPFDTPLPAIPGVVVSRGEW